ncbi:dynein axonemal heavy chain 10-like [Scophthalmus maximus]|uniref:dynein axonemal heavy chain 10-like n=1 Tax=Scophthalmus maximus TaxID=52904 RepID=UPI001FA8CCA8|nr:dynein axonemal heavy chain 10-like [Scophthalmus maximus]
MQCFTVTEIILEEFYDIFGPELKGVTGDLKHIDEMLCRVDSLVLPIEEVNFDPFNICKKSSWKTIMQDLNTTVETIDSEAISLIDQSFKTLRSSAAAFDVLLKFKHMRSREAISNHLMRKFNHILALYCKEVDIINELFKANKDNPPLNKPPVAGSIKWARSLLYRIKHTILPFLDLPEMLESEQGKVAKDKLRMSHQLKAHDRGACDTMYVDELRKLVNCFHSVMDSLSDAKFIMLAQQMKAVKKVMHFGCERLNWKSLDVKEFCEHIERERGKSVNLLVMKYSDIGHSIIKTEHLIMDTSSGKAKCMADYYLYWEEKVFDSLTKMVLRSIQAFNVAVMGRTALFQVDAILSAPEIVLQPHNNEIYWLIMHCLSDCVESTKKFVRWMRGTCIKCPPKPNESVAFSFYSDVKQHPQINESAITVSQNIQQLVLSLDQYLGPWRRYRPLWEKDITIINEKFAASHPSWVVYDDKLLFLSGVRHEVMLKPLFNIEHIIHLNLKPLVHTVQKIVESWINSLGGLLNNPTKEDLFNLRDELMELDAKLKQSPDTLEDLKSVLGTISDIKCMSADVEIRFIDIRERYRTLAMYKVEVGEDELELVASIGQIWSDLFTESRQVDRCLTNAKKSFTQITKEKTEEFKKEVSIFAESFDMHGPGAVGDDLEKGLTILETYEADLANIMAGRQKLANAEKLFDLPVTVFPEIITMQKEMMGLRQIYDIYKAQKDAKTDWSQTLWVHLDIQLLQDGVEGFSKSLRQLPKHVRALPVAYILEGRLKEFRESLPLLLDLKNDALRDRHWKELMERTGTNFDMNPDTFTLENMFAMELHKYANVIGDIVTSAVKELGIEKASIRLCQ